MDAFGYLITVLVGVLAILCTLLFMQKEKEKSKDEMIQSLLTDLNSHDELYEKGIKASRKYKFQKALRARAAMFRCLSVTIGEE